MITREQQRWLHGAVSQVTTNVTWLYDEIWETVDVDGSVYVPEDTVILPVTFRHVAGDFVAGGTKLKTLKGSPRTVDGSFAINATPVNSLNGGPESVGSIMIHGSHVRELVGLPHTVHGSVYVDLDNVGGRMLQVFKYPQIHQVVIMLDDYSLSALAVTAIINKHLQEDRDILLCQDELIEAGYHEYAKL